MPKSTKGKHGGKRKGSGRKKGYKVPKEKLKEKTVVMRIPLSKVEAVKKLIKAKRK
jgi:hypothetical protein